MQVIINSEKNTFLEGVDYLALWEGRMLVNTCQYLKIEAPKGFILYS